MKVNLKKGLLTLSRSIFFSSIFFSSILCLLSNTAYGDDSIFEYDKDSDLMSLTGGNNFNLERPNRKDNDIISRIFKKEPAIKKSASIRVRVVEISKSDVNTNLSNPTEESVNKDSEKLTPERKQNLEDTNDLYTEKLSDVSRKLATLPFNHFRVLSDTYIEAPINQVKNLVISEDQNLAIKPLYFHDNKLCVQLDWKDSTGSQVLDSQLHFRIGESIIAGSESSEEKGLLLILNAEKE